MPKLYPALARAGLINLGIQAQQIVVPCGMEMIPAFTLLLDQIRDKLVAAGLGTEGAVTAAIDELEAPSSTVVYGPILVSVWGGDQWADVILSDGIVAAQEWRE